MKYQIDLLPQYAYPHRPPLRYFGGKWRIAKWLLQHYPIHRGYCTPYGGGWCESFQKPRSGHLEVYNDLNAHNINFFTQLKENPHELIAQIEKTPRDWQQFEISKQSCDDPVEWAKRYYIYCHLSVMAGGGKLSSGTSESRLALRSVTDDTHLWAASHRLQGVIIEQLDAVECIAKYDSKDTFFYCDPGYPKSSLATGNRTWYLHHTNTEGHIALAETLHQIKGSAIVSGYDCPLYQKLFNGWEKIEYETVNMRRSKAIECIWIKR